MSEFLFDPVGDRPNIAVFIGQAQVGSYDLRLWESGSNDIVMEESGNYRNPDDDRFDLPRPVADNNGRLVQCQFAIVSPDIKPGDTYYVALKFNQQGRNEQIVDEEGPVTGKSLHPELIVTLKAG